ncbi:MULTISPECIES: SDR family NAD(P)-dependent oxidoreductase [unclassified Thalassospira]|jgi:NAD(P)-dependent dehydrogenase (short-subunit alcohol dehydrogenase family)|uniref:SDR family NAD(P)-dependent oxidoreductase n=1 Tax=unclassified Thalassospira TaxID=2648997 RepID=UPI000ED73DEE|nr:MULTISPECIES: SDR family NAD(P)-dependent oxidoreductase [unclassified Thalassospira]HAI28598.1 3-hydroxyacyl-CoA dehydrogenase [Thalassospira sp.]|tara:strand:+ start:9576 stop:10337 length:762 start_codon:yes stop_codon:yes gene_type:complete
MQIKGSIAIVTGAASGLGAATAETLANAGARIAAFDLNADGAKATAEKLGGVGYGVDVSNAESVEHAVSKVVKDIGIPSILVNCAGIVHGERIVGREGPADLEAFSKVITVNLIGTFNMMRVAATAMSQNTPSDSGERGVIINTASIAAFEGQIGQAAYAASKGGVASLTLPAARELARHGVRVASIAPGLFGTPMLMGLPDEVQESLAANTPFPKRLGDPYEYGRLAMHICENEMINGETIRIDGAVRLEPK